MKGLAHGSELDRALVDSRSVNLLSPDVLGQVVERLTDRESTSAWSSSEPCKKLFMVI
jgi:hypothetical protein